MTTLKLRNSAEFGNSVSELLKERGVTQAEFAKQAGFSAAYISDILTGKRSPSGKMADFFACSLRLSKQERKKLHVLAARDNGFDVD